MVTPDPRALEGLEREAAAFIDQHKCHLQMDCHAFAFKGGAAAYHVEVRSFCEATAYYEGETATPDQILKHMAEWMKR